MGDIAAFLEQALAEKGAQKPRHAGDRKTLSKMHGDRFLWKSRGRKK
jgi:hypothetical protein